MAGQETDIGAVLEQSTVAAALIDADGHVLFFNEAAERLWGYERGEVLGRHMIFLLPPVLRAMHEDYMRRHRDDGRPVAVGMSREILLERKDGRQLWTSFAFAKMAVDGRVHYLVSARDVTDEVARREESRLLLLAINHTDQPILMLDEARRIVQVNRAFTRLFGYGAEESIGQVPTQLLATPNTDRAVLERLRRKKREESQEFWEELLVGCKDGREVWVRMAVNPVPDEDGRVRNLVLAVSDVTEERQIRDLERDVLQALTSDLSFEEVGNFLCRRIEAIAPGVVTTVGRIEDRRIRPWASPFFPQEYADTWNGVEIGEGVASCGTSAHRGEPVMVYDIDSDPLWLPYKHLILPYGLRACWTYPVKRRDGSVAGTFGFYFREGGGSNAYLERVAEASVHLCTLAIEREENRLRIAQLVRFDILTGLPNHAHLEHSLSEMLTIGKAREISCFSVGLDRFKDINATLGHAAGDQVLVTMANRLQKRLVPGQFLARPEGDLFFVVASNCGVRGASLLAERLLRMIAEPVTVGGHQLSLSASVGISHFPKGGKERCELIANAKHAMYRAKEAGGGTYQFFTPEMNVMAQERLLLGEALKRAIAAGELSLYYQPQIHTDSGKVHGFEALARWRDKELGEIPPGKFIGLAEETGQIEAISHWVLREACRQLHAWRAMGEEVPRVSVNLSPINFHRHLPGFVAGLLEEFELPGDSLTIEITESTMVALTDEMLDVVHEIRALGVGLSVDDFGTGFSSLSNLVNLPVTEVKIDRSFVAAFLEERRLRSLVAAVVGLGRSLGLTVVAEGVETPEQQALLKQFRCPVLQGYLFASPLSPADAMAWANGVEARHLNEFIGRHE